MKRLLQKFFHYKYYGSLMVIKSYSTLFTKLIFFLKGVQIGKHSSFYGFPLIYCFPGSTINIGDNFQLRNHKNSNLIGINKRSIISTHRKETELIIGNDCAFSGTVIGAMQSIKIGNNVMIGANVLVTDFDWHSLDPTDRHFGTPKSKSVVIEDNVFIGYSATILKGVRIGKNSIIGANSVVTTDIPENVIAAGNPCKVVSNLKYGK